MSVNFLNPSQKKVTYAIDAWSANQAQKTGVEMYAYQLIQAMKRRVLSENEQVILYSPTKLEGDLAVLPKGWESKTLPWPVKKRWFSVGWMQIRVSLELIRHRPDVFFVPSQGLPRRFPFFDYPILTTIHDIGFIPFPNLYDARSRRRLVKFTKRSLRRATHLLTVSEFSKQEITKQFRIADDRITVTPLAMDRTEFYPRSTEEISPILQKYRLAKGLYFFTIGRLEAKKNTANLIRAFEIFKQARGVGDPITLVLCGTDGYGAEEVRRLCEASPFKQSIRCLGWVPKEDIPALVNGASAFLFPSIYEGFGIPNLEALACDIPLLTSDIPVHHEVVGEAGLFLPPLDTNAWAQAMERILEDQTLRQNLITKGRIQVEKFSWEKTAEMTWKSLFSL